MLCVPRVAFFSQRRTFWEDVLAGVDGFTPAMYTLDHHVVVSYRQFYFDRETNQQYKTDIRSMKILRLWWPFGHSKCDLWGIWQYVYFDCVQWDQQTVKPSRLAHANLCASSGMSLQTAATSDCTSHSLHSMSKYGLHIHIQSLLPSVYYDLLLPQDKFAWVSCFTPVLRNDHYIPVWCALVLGRLVLGTIKCIIGFLFVSFSCHDTWPLGSSSAIRC